jgi:hypothetical protein
MVEASIDAAKSGVLQKNRPLIAFGSRPDLYL